MFSYSKIFYGDKKDDFTAKSSFFICPIQMSMRSKSSMSFVSISKLSI